MTSEKDQLRAALRKARGDHVAEQPDAIRALLFNHPPRSLLEKIAEPQVIGLYHAGSSEAPASGYARFFHEAGHTIALPYFADDSTPMEFREHSDPIAETDLEKGAFGMMQPQSSASAVTPDLLFVPLVGFTDKGHRLGQGGGHYDRYLATYANTLAIGLAWDIQLCEDLPIEPHDITLDAVITPTRLYGPF